MDLVFIRKAKYIEKNAVYLLNALRCSILPIVF